MKREYEANLIKANLTKLNMSNNMAVMEFINVKDGTVIKEELDLLETHQLFKFSMFLKSFHIKKLEHARRLLNIFIEHKIEIGLVVDRQNKIIYSNELTKDQMYEFKKHILLNKLIVAGKITRDMYEEMISLEYKEVRSIIG